MIRFSCAGSHPWSHDFRVQVGSDRNLLVSHSIRQSNLNILTSALADPAHPRFFLFSSSANQAQQPEEEAEE